LATEIDFVATKVSISSGGTSFVDSSIDPNMILESLEFTKEWVDWYLYYEEVRKIIKRFLTSEFAIGFDGVDDYISVPNLEISDQRMELETEVWISRENRESTLLSIVDDNEEPFLVLKTTDEVNFRTKAYYRNGNNMKSEILQNFAIEEWQEIEVESDGEILSITVNGNQKIFLNDIELGEEPFELKFGRDSALHYFEGMIRRLKIISGSNKLFDLKAGRNIDIKDETESAVIVGAHNKKDPFEKEFN
jgi:hypothetical protein